MANASRVQDHGGLLRTSAGPNGNLNISTHKASRPTSFSSVAPHGDKSVKSANAKILAPLRETRLLGELLKPSLPAELIASILDLLSATDLIACARVSRRMRDMVYDDSRWVRRLRAMGCWDESAARRRLEENMRKKLAREKGTVASDGEVPGPGVTLFDAGWEYQRSLAGPASPASPLSPVAQRQGVNGGSVYDEEANKPLHIFALIKSVRGGARHEYGKVHQTLAPFYFDIVSAGHRPNTEALVFRTFAEPEGQARLLANLKAFAHSDWALGWPNRHEQLSSLSDIFEKALLREFRVGYQARDYDGQMRRYAHILELLSGGASSIQAFLQENPILSPNRGSDDPLRCVEGVAHGHVDLGPSRDFLQGLVSGLNEQAEIIEHVFPTSLDVMTPLVERILGSRFSDYVTTLFDECHRLNRETFLKAVSGVLDQSLQFLESLRPPPAIAGGFKDKTLERIIRVFEPHLDLYLAEEFHHFRDKSKSEIDTWERQLSEQEQSTEIYLMSNVQRQSEKRDFLTSFKKVVMMPVNVLTINPNSSQSSISKATTRDRSHTGTHFTEMRSRSSTPNLHPGDGISRIPSPTPEAPTSELAAKAAIMNSKLEGIKTLFSIEVALNLVHAAKACIERASEISRLEGQWRTEARAQCNAIFVDLLDILGFRHIKPGFDKAVQHLTSYNARDITEHSRATVQPLVTFLELVNVGDLIQQMVDVFYVQELVAKKLSDSEDFLDPAAKEKKRFEQMLDERVAAGMSKGIDVLIQEVEHIYATLQAPTDFNAVTSDSGNAGMMDISPTPTAVHVVKLVSTHTNMLVGSTDKNVLEVFNQEVGVRLFASFCKHLKRQRVSTDGAIRLISDINHYSDYISGFRNKELLRHFHALRELAQIFLISPSHAKEIAVIIADGDRYRGIFRAEEVYEFAQRRADWYQIKANVEKAMYGVGCSVM